MKANEAPEKLYFDVNNNLIGLYDSAILGMFSAKNTETSIEYTRTDAFIERAENYLRNKCQRFILTEKDIVDFVKYMEGE